MFSHHSDRDFLVLVLKNQESQMARTDALTSAVVDLTSIVGQAVSEVNGTEDQAAIDAAAVAIEAAVAELKALLPKPAVPVVSGLSPTEGPAGTSVIITGSGFAGATAVEFGVDFGGPVPTFTVDSDTQITTTVPEVTAGAAPVTVTGPGGTSTSQTFTVV